MTPITYKKGSYTGCLRRVAVLVLMLLLVTWRTASAQSACVKDANGVVDSCYGVPYLHEMRPAIVYGGDVAFAQGKDLDGALQAAVWHGRGVQLTMEVYGSTAEQRMVTP